MVPTLRSATGTNWSRASGIGEPFAAELEQRRDGRQEVVQVVGHAAGHAAEQFELLGDQQFVLEPDLIEDEAEVFGELEQQVEVQRRVGFVIGFYPAGECRRAAG